MSKKLSEITLKDLQSIEREVAKNEKAGADFLLRPRRFLHERGFLVPMDTVITILPTEEKQARMSTKQGLEDFFVESGTQNQARIKVHVMDGFWRCTTVYMDGPCPAKRASNPATGGQDIFSEMSVQEFYSIVAEAEANDKLANELISDPRRYFESKGFYGGPDVVVTAIHSSKYMEELADEDRLSRWVSNDNRPLGIVYHITKGSHKCTHIEVTCDCDKK